MLLWTLGMFQNWFVLVKQNTNIKLVELKDYKMLPHRFFFLQKILPIQNLSTWHVDFDQTIIFKEPNKNFTNIILFTRVMNMIINYTKSVFFLCGKSINKYNLLPKVENCIHYAGWKQFYFDNQYGPLAPQWLTYEQRRWRNTRRKLRFMTINVIKQP